MPCRRTPTHGRVRRTGRRPGLRGPTSRRRRSPSLGDLPPDRSVARDRTAGLAAHEGRQLLPYARELALPFREPARADAVRRKPSDLADLEPDLLQQLVDPALVRPPVVD